MLDHQLRAVGELMTVDTLTLCLRNLPALLQRLLHALPRRAEPLEMLPFEAVVNLAIAMLSIFNIVSSKSRISKGI